ncbi:hypothetical protein NQZ68_018523 [Dissostichus eleginoides]|nr:hypothetical protein NQZ68_018523 [Dissostichus eleginoides]
MSSVSEQQKSGQSPLCALWSVDLKLTHLDWNPEATLIHFQGHYLSICDLDYNILQGEIQNTPKTQAAVAIGEFCLVEDLTSGHCYRGRVQNRKEDLFDVFLIDHGNVLSVDKDLIYSCSNDLFSLPPKIVCGFLANILLPQGCSHSLVEAYFTNLIGRNVTGYIKAFLPHKVLLLEAPEINNDLVRHGFGRHVDSDTFFLLVGMLIDVPLKQSTEQVPDLLIEKPRAQEFCFKRADLQGYEYILSLCGPRLSCGTRAKVRVTAAVNPELFYCQMTSVDTDLWEMSKKLAEVNEYQTMEHNQKTPENLGLLCSVKGKDEKWHRGLVQFLPVNSQLQVLYIDYGFLESVKVENVYRLPPELFSTPIMAFPCSLFSLGDEVEAVKTQQLSFLKAGLLGKVLDVEIKRFEEQQHLYSITVIGAEENQVAEPKPTQELPKMKVPSVFEMEEKSPQCGYLNCETIMGKAMAKTLKEEELDVNSVFVGYVEHVQNPNIFWIRSQQLNDEFEEMMTKMADNYSQVKLDEDVLLNPEPGTLCCAVYEKDMHFYRCVVAESLEHGSEVLFIDFGNIEKVPRMMIKKIPETLAKKAAFAFCCTLVNVFPMDEFWTTAKTDFFRRAVSNKALRVHIVQKGKNKCVVDLYVMEDDNNQSITELLISSKQAQYWNNIDLEPAVKNKTTFTEKTRRPKHRVTPDITGNSEQLRDCAEEEKTFKNLTEKAQALFKAISIKPGYIFAVCCTWINSPSDFWCQLQDKVPALEELMDKVNQYYSIHRVPLQSGDSCCVAKSPLDGRWYRAFITQKHNGHAIVMLVDYGLTIHIKEHNLQAIKPEFVHLEGQAFRCSLSTPIKPTGLDDIGNCSPECKLMKDFVLDTPIGLRCQVVSQFSVKNKGLCSVVELYNIQTQKTLTNLGDKGLPREALFSTKQQHIVFPESFVYSSYDISPGNEEQLHVTHVSSQWEVYCQLDRNTDIIDELENNISTESEKMMQATTTAVTKLCLAKYSDGKWYRGLVQPVQSPLHLNVFFVDYGNATISEKTNVMCIPRDSMDVLYTPMQAVKCHLASVSKEPLYADVKDWLDGAILNKQVRAVVNGKYKDGSFFVELFDGDVNINEKVRELIRSLSPTPKTVVTFDVSSTKTNHKTHQKPNTKDSIKCKKASSDSSCMLDACRSTQAGRAPCKKKENLVKTVHGQTQKTNARVEKQGEYTYTNSKQPQITEESEIPQCSCLPNRSVSAGFRAKCFVSHIDSVSSFDLQLSEDEPSILKMGEDLNSSSFRETLKTTTSLRVNDIVLAEFEEDGALYRSAVTDCDGNSFIKVEFVDYGNSAVIKKENTYSLPKEYLSQPRFSISCSLMDTSMYQNDASFTDAVMEKPLMVEFVSHQESHWVVKFEIIDEAAGLPTALEADVESTYETIKEEAFHADSSKNEEKARSSEQNYMRKEVSENQTTQSERASLDGENQTLEPTVKADEIMPPTVQDKDTKSGTVLSVLSNGNFYISLNETRELLAALEHFIAENLSVCKILAEEDVKQGLKCLVQVDHDKKWHRAVVQVVGQGKCQVLLVDHGITEEVRSCSIQRQCIKLTQIHNFAVLCKMNCLGFSEAEDAHEFWCETLKPMIGKEVKLVFVSRSEANQLWKVEIVMNGLFLFSHITTSLQQNKEMVSSPADIKEEGESNLDTNPPRQLVFASIDLYKEYSGFATEVTTPMEFCVVPDDLLLVTNQVSIMLEDLPEPMSSLPEAHIVPGTCCLFKSDTKDKWRRAEIVNIDTTAVLNLVDYGHYKCIPYEECSQLKRLPEELTNSPKVTFPCILHGVKPVGEDSGQWSDEAAVFFQQCFYEKNLQISFREFVSNTHWKVDILADGVHVAKELVDAGYADYTDNILGMMFQEQISRCPESDEEFGLEDEGSDDQSDLLVDSTDESEPEMPLSLVEHHGNVFCREGSNSPAIPNHSA